RVLFFASPEGAQFKQAQPVLWLRVSPPRQSGKESEVSHIAPEDCRKKERESQARACRQSEDRRYPRSPSAKPRIERVTSAAVSVRKMRGPRPTVAKPEARAASTSSRAKPPSGPMAMTICLGRSPPGSASRKPCPR